MRDAVIVGAVRTPGGGMANATVPERLS